MLYFSFVASSIQPTLRTESLFLQMLSSLTGHDLCTASQQSCAFGSHCRPQTNQYAIHRTPQSCCPTWQLRSSCFETSCHAAPSCHFIAWLKVLSLAMIRHCICSTHHILTCSFMSVLFISISCCPHSRTGGPSTHILLTALELFLLHRNSIFIQRQTKVNDSHISLQ